MRTAIIIGLCISSVQCLFGQIESTQYFMTSLPQVVESNPAFLPKYKFALGIPGSRLGVSYSNNGFNYNDATREENGNVILDLDKWAASLPEKTYITNASQADMFRLGLGFGKNFYLSIHSSVRGYTQGMVPKDVASLLVGGTGPYVGKTANLSPTFHGMTFWESGVGISMEPVKKLRVGARLKKLYGGHSVMTEHSDISLSVAENYAIDVAADLHVRTSGLENTEFNFTSYLKNSGWSTDLGATYEIIPRLTVAASIADLGYIKWRNNIYDYTLNKETANFNFSGFDVGELIDGNTNSLEQDLDSLREDFTPVEGEGSDYTMALPAKFYLSGTFDITKSFNAGALFFTEQFMGRTAVGWTASLNKNFGKFLSTSLSYTLSNRATNTLGAGLSLNLAPVQIYIVGDDLLRAPIMMARTGFVNDYVNSTQVFNVRFGVNFVWGWRNDAAQQGEQQGGEDSKAYNKKKSGSKTTTNKKKQPQPKKKGPPPHIRARQRMKT